MSEHYAASPAPSPVKTLGYAFETTVSRAVGFKLLFTAG